MRPAMRRLDPRPCLKCAPAIVGLLCVVALAALTPQLATSATAYYVTTSGSAAGTGSKASPYDLASGISHMAVGDTLRIQQGAYGWNESANGALTFKDNTVVE